MRELAQQIVELCGAGNQGRSAIEHAPARPGEILRSCAVVERLAALGAPATTTLLEGLRKTLA